MSRVFFLILIFLISNCPLICKAESKSLNNLPKTKDTTVKVTGDKIQDEDKSRIDGENKEINEDDGDPTKVFKLIAIYLINKQPRALIKNSEKPEDGPKEYQVGEYVDDLQQYSISKISFNPTARIEIIDKDGLAYLIKAQNTDDKNSAAKPKSTFSSKSSPTYFSGTGSKKAKKSFTTQETPQEPSQATSSPSGTETKPPAETTATQPVQQPPSQPQQGQQAQQGTAPPPQAAIPQGQPAQGSTSSQQAVQIGGSVPSPPKTDKPPTGADSLDVSRPANPFN